jgi:hypothetical protein
MTEMKEAVAPMLMLPPPSTTLYNCKWRCAPGQNGPHEDKWHLKEPPYPEGGKADRDADAPKQWKKDGHVPWLLDGAVGPGAANNPGIDSRKTHWDYHHGRSGPVSSYPHPEYYTEGHHCISCDVFKESEYPALVHNALLMGYDINCKENGFHVPGYIVDIVCHDLQNHASSHTWTEPAPLKYELDEKTGPLLQQLQDRCYRYCSADPLGTAESQRHIIEDLHWVSDIIRTKIKNWRWFLTKHAKMRLGEVGDYGKNKEAPRPAGVLKDKVKGDGFDLMRKYAEMALNKENLMPKGFPKWDHYIAAALKELDDGENPDQPFARWLTGRMLREKLGTASKTKP